MLQIKWPNDILLNGGKVAGILCEQCLGGGQRPAGALIVGVGVNVAFEPRQLAGPLRHPATSLKAAGGDVAVDDVIAAIARELEKAMTAFEAEGLSHAILSELRSRLAYVGEIQTCAATEGAFTGRVCGVDAAGRLLLDAEVGEIACDAGELIGEGEMTSSNPD
jgi:BirA family biotin operon repressor/biotin-[acetyl-CoA-carboxylase] ligase